MSGNKITKDSLGMQIVAKSAHPELRPRGRESRSIGPVEGRISRSYIIL